MLTIHHEKIKNNEKDIQYSLFIIHPPLSLSLAAGILW
jgi:hypothetical protein